MSELVTRLRMTSPYALPGQSETYMHAAASTLEAYERVIRATRAMKDYSDAVIERRRRASQTVEMKLSNEIDLSLASLADPVDGGGEGGDAEDVRGLHGPAGHEVRAVTVSPNRQEVTE